MDLYSIKGNKLNNVELNSFKKEREIQDLVEKNTETLFDIDFVSSEFKINPNLGLIPYVLIMKQIHFYYRIQKR